MISNTYMDGLLLEDEQYPLNDHIKILQLPVLVGQSPMDETSLAPSPGRTSLVRLGCAL